MGNIERIKEEIEYYSKKIYEYKEGNVDPNIRGIRAIMGVYPEREKEKYMQRIKTPAGVVSTKQLASVSEIADKYSHGKIHFTTRQDIQFQGVELEDTLKIMKEILEIGINTLGAGGNSARNVACSPLSGVEKGEAFDVTPYAIATADQLLSDPSTIKLPRKYKVAFSNNESDTAYATIADLGFVAKVQDGKRGFEVYGAGGLGGSPVKALKLEDFICEEDVPYYVKAMKELFEAEGDRQNKNRARIRYIVYRLGEEKFREVFKYYVDKSKNEGALVQNLITNEISYKEESGSYTGSSRIVTEQKQKGYYSVFIHPKNGYISISDLNKVLAYVGHLDYETSIRLTNTQGFYIRDIKGKDVEKFLDLVSGFAVQDSIDDIVTCVGVTVCGTGLCNSQGLASAIRDKFFDAPEAVKNALPGIFISGCPNSCGQHQIGKIGFSGKAIKGQDGMIPAYRVFVNGAIGVNKTRLGEAKGDIAAKKIPEFLHRLSLLVLENNIADFEQFVEKEWDKVEALIKEFQVFEEDTQLYYDFGLTEKFMAKK